MRVKEITSEDIIQLCRAGIWDDVKCFTAANPSLLANAGESILNAAIETGNTELVRHFYAKVPRASVSAGLIQRVKQFLK